MMQNIPSKEEVEKIKLAAIEDMREVIREGLADKSLVGQDFPQREMGRQLREHLELSLEKVIFARAEALSGQIIIGAHVGEIIRLVAGKVK